MPSFLSVLCRSARPVSLEELKTFVREGWFFDEPAHIEPVPEDRPALGMGWTCVEIHYQEGKRPVVLTHLSQPGRLEAQKQEALEELGQHSLQGQHTELTRHLQDCQQAFVFEVDPVGASEECWMMVDALEAWLARSRDGVVFVPGEGFYDATLQLLCKLCA